MCNDDKKFATLKRLRKPQEAMLGDGHVLEAIGQGTVSLDIKLPAANQECLSYMMYSTYQSCHTIF